MDFFQFCENDINSHLGGAPLDRKFGATITCVLVVYHIPAQRELHSKVNYDSQLPCQSKICNFDHIFCSDETISGSKVSVDVVVSLQIGHPPAHLVGFYLARISFHLL